MSHRTVRVLVEQGSRRSSQVNVSKAGFPKLLETPALPFGSCLHGLASVEVVRYLLSVYGPAACWQFWLT